MSAGSLGRQEFVRLGAGAAGLGAVEQVGKATGVGGRSDSSIASEYEQPAKPHSSAIEWQIVEDLLGSVGAPREGLQRRSESNVLVDRLTAPFSSRYGDSESGDLLPAWSLDKKTV